MPYILIYIKAIFIYFVAFTLIRFNRKGIGEQTSYDYTLLIILGTVAGDPLSNSYNLYETLTGLVGLWTGHKIAVFVARFNVLQSILHGKPKYLIHSGTFKTDQFYSSKLTISELYTELRLSGHGRLSDIQWALIEPSGKISFIPKVNVQQNPVCVEPLIVDGIVQQQCLAQLGQNAAWLNSQLETLGFADTNKILIAEITDNNQLTIFTK